MYGDVALTSTAPQPQIFILDRCPLFTQSIIYLLEARDCHIVGAAHSVSCLNELRNKLSTDRAILLIGPLLHTADGFSACRWAREQAIDIRVIFISCHADDINVCADAALLGVFAFVSIELTSDELVSTVRLVWKGNALLPQSLQIAEADRLTECELRVLRLMAEDMSYKEIAATLKVSINTVRNQAQSILAKLHVQSRKDAVYRGYHRGLI